MIKSAIDEMIMGKNLSLEITKEVMREITEGKATNAQIASFLTAMRFKGETIEEITACAEVMREKCDSITPSSDVLDIVGTGGDELSTFNISTVSSIIVASANIPVAKHGNRSVSSKCGSADLLETLGVKIDITPSRSQEILNKINICFLFSPNHHSNMKYAAPVRKELGIRTLFNTIGPLANPANATLQLLGVYDETLVEPMARVLNNLKVKRGMVVHGHDGLDEISLCDTTTICEISYGKLNSFFITPEQFGFKRCELKDITGGYPEENARIALNILNGEKSAKRDIVVLNSAFCIYMAQNKITLKECVKTAEKIIDSGKAKDKLKDFIKLSNEVDL